MPSTSGAFDSPQEPASLAQQAYLAIRDRILKGRLKLGAPLSRRKLAADLGMSLLPVAEALQRLEMEGLVESRPRIGTRVCQPTVEDVRERYQIREALETQSARLYAEKASPQQRSELQAMAERMDELFNRCSAGPIDPDSLYEIHDYHARFHLRIAECAGCGLLRQALERNHVMLFNWVYDVAAKRPPVPPYFHRELIEGLNQGDPEIADRAMRKHVRDGFQLVARGIKPQPAAPSIESASNPSKRRVPAPSGKRQRKR